MHRLFYLFLLGVAVALFLLIRGWVDRTREQALDIDIPRDGEEHLGIWANKSDAALMQFRLHRDGSFTYKLLEYPAKDTVTTTGTYDIVGVGDNRRTDRYPRLIALNEKKDTLLNLFIAYITPYDSKVDKVDRMVVSPNGIYDTVSYTFYRIKPLK